MKTLDRLTAELPCHGSERFRSLAYSMDALIPGVYLWVGNWVVQIGGSPAESSYPGTVHSWAGFAIVWSGFRMWSTYTGSFDA